MILQNYPMCEMYFNRQQGKEGDGVKLLSKPENEDIRLRFYIHIPTE